MGSSGLIEAFERRFLAARPLPSFPWRSLEEKLKNSLDSELLLNILQKTVLHPLCVKHPPSVKYTRCFLSELIKKHEAAHTEPLDELYEALAEILSAEESTQGHRSYLLPSGNSISLCESTAIISQGTTGLVTWDAALYLAEWAIENPEAFTNRRVLELGSGAGFTGLAICKMCSPTAYIFSDCHSQVLQQLKGNILLNGFLLNPDSTAPLQPSVSTLVSPKPIVMAVQLDWEQVTTKQLSVFQPDVIIAADVLYDPEIILSLIGVLQKLSACQADQKPPEIYIAFTAYWWAVLLMGIALIMLMAGFIKICSVHTPSSNPKLPPPKPLPGTLKRRRPPQAVQPPQRQRPRESYQMGHMRR